MKYSLLAVLAFGLMGCATAPAEASRFSTPACAPAGFDRARLDALKASNWEIADEALRNRFALELTACLGDRDTNVRDGIAFEALQHYMRNNLLTTQTLAALNTDLQAKLHGLDPEGFQRPFAALVLADVARTDRLAPWMSPQQRSQLIDAAVSYMGGITDHRGFSEGEGYRHAAAHASDLMLQLVLNEAMTKPDLIRIRDAIGTQIAPDGHFYIYGESERLAAPILYMAQRNAFSEAEWTAWFTQVASPGPLGASWDDWYNSDRGLSRRHNLMAFFTVMQTNLSLTQNPVYAPERAGVLAAIQSLP